MGSAIVMESGIHLMPAKCCTRDCFHSKHSVMKELEHDPNPLLRLLLEDRLQWCWLVEKDTTITILTIVPPVQLHLGGVDPSPPLQLHFGWALEINWPCVYCLKLTVPE